MTVLAKRPGLLIRSAAWAPGWEASITPARGGPSRTVQVSQLGLVETIELPAGESRVRWFYAPRGVIASGSVSLVSGAVIILLAIMMLERRRLRTGREARRFTRRIERSAEAERL